MNRGALETAAAMERRGIGVNEAAKMLGTDSGNLSRILREEDGRKPGLRLANRIFSELGVGPSLWDQPVEVPTEEHTNSKHTEQPAKPAA